MRRGLFIVVAVLVVVLATAGSAGAHSAFLGSTPEPGARLERGPRLVKLTFTEPLNERLSTATVVRLGSGGGPVRTRGRPSGKRLILEVLATLPRGAYQVRWHTVSTRDGHALEGTFAFGVRAAVAGGGEHDVQQSPFARQGELRVAARVLLYASLLVFGGALLVQAMLGGRDGRCWLTLADTGDPARVRVSRRERAIVLHAGCVAVGAAALSAAADAADAAGGFSARGLAEFLLYADAGLTRLAVVGLLAVALAVVAAGRRRAAVVPAAAAMLALAVSGHANASAPRALAVLVDWLHLLSAAVWAGGIAVLVLVWLPLLSGAPRSRRHAVAGQVLPAFGRVALPAFVVVAVTGMVSAGIELGRVTALWQSDYGRVLMVKVSVVVLIAAASAVHAWRLRPRFLAERIESRSRSERRHWRLLGVEPVLGLGVVAAVGVLVAFPLPPRQLDDAGSAEAAVAAVPDCSPCPLPSPRPGELAVAEHAGSNVAAAWVRRDGAALVGTVRVYGLNKRPRPGPLRVPVRCSARAGAGAEGSAWRARHGR